MTNLYPHGDCVFVERGKENILMNGQIKTKLASFSKSYLNNL